MTEALPFNSHGNPASWYYCILCTVKEMTAQRSQRLIQGYKVNEEVRSHIWSRLAPNLAFWTNPMRVARVRAWATGEHERCGRWLETSLPGIAALARAHTETDTNVWEGLIEHLWCPGQECSKSLIENEKLLRAVSKTVCEMVRAQLLETDLCTGLSPSFATCQVCDAEPWEHSRGETLKQHWQNTAHIMFACLVPQKKQAGTNEL